MNRFDAGRFSELWQRLLPMDSHLAGPVFRRLQAQYAEPSRCYHNWRHIEDCLQWLDGCRAEVEDADALELALWFHDAVLESLEGQGHEARSAAFLVGWSTGMEPTRQQRVVNLIMATTHAESPKFADARLMADIDLSSFAKAWPAYLRDTARCRAERRDLDDLGFCLCQGRFLKRMQARPHFFSSDHFRRHHESRAQANISGMLRLLERREAALATAE